MLTLDPLHVKPNTIVTFDHDLTNMPNIVLVYTSHAILIVSYR